MYRLFFIFTLFFTIPGLSHAQALFPDGEYAINPNAEKDNAYCYDQISNQKNFTKHFLNQCGFQNWEDNLEGSKNAINAELVCKDRYDTNKKINDQKPFHECLTSVVFKTGEAPQKEQVEEMDTDEAQEELTTTKQVAEVNDVTAEDFNKINIDEEITRSEAIVKEAKIIIAKAKEMKVEADYYSIENSLLDPRTILDELKGHIAMKNKEFYDASIGYYQEFLNKIKSDMTMLRSKMQETKKTAKVPEDIPEVTLAKNTLNAASEIMNGSKKSTYVTLPSSDFGYLNAMTLQTYAGAYAAIAKEFAQLALHINTSMAAEELQDERKNELTATLKQNANAAKFYLDEAIKFVLQLREANQISS